VKKPNQHELVKLYYRIGEVSRIVGVQPHVLRYWESEFRTIRPQKSNKGQRVYSRRDVEKLLRVKDLLKNQGFTIAGARKQLAAKSTTGAARQSDANERARASVSSPASAEARAGQDASARGSSQPTSVGPVDAAPPVSAKQLRRSLVSLRAELCEMLAELQRTYGRPDS
jgi:DNA-binding transcriptional MerR regulator